MPQASCSLAGVVKAVLLGVFDFGFDVVLVFQSALLMDVCGNRAKRAKMARLSTVAMADKECRFGLHYIP